MTSYADFKIKWIQHKSIQNVIFDVSILIKNSTNLIKYEKMYTQELF